MSVIKLLIVAGCVGVLSGCASMANSMNAVAGIGVLKERVSTYDGSRVIEVTPNWLHNPQSSMWANQIKMGARWSSASPDFIGITLRYVSSAGSPGPAYTSFREIRVLMDGRERVFKAGRGSYQDSGYNSVARDIFTESEAVVIMPLDFVRQMVEAKTCTVRISASDWYEEADFTIERKPGGGDAAKLSIAKLLQKISAYR